MSASWREYQDEAAAFFRSLGLNAVSDVRVQGVRTTHDIDVLVKSRHAGFEVTWIVECKLWNAPVSKLHVLVTCPENAGQPKLEKMAFAAWRGAHEEEPIHR